MTEYKLEALPQGNLLLARSPNGRRNEPSINRPMPMSGSYMHLRRWPAERRYNGLTRRGLTNIRGPELDQTIVLEPGRWTKLVGGSCKPTLGI